MIIEWIRQHVQNWKDAVQLVASWCGYRILRPATPNIFDAVLSARLANSGTCNTIQIGANDGVWSDPIRRYLMARSSIARGVLVEPLREPHAQLVANYASVPGLSCVRSAIHPTDKRVTLSYPKGRRYTFASCNSDIVRFWTGEQSFEEESVGAMSPLELVTLANLPHVDLLQIDAEGIDGDILEAWPWYLCRPSVVHFEHTVLPREQILRVVSMLQRCGYSVGMEASDITAWLFADVYSELMPINGRWTSWDADRQRKAG